MILDYIRVAFSNLKRRKKRTFLTLIGIFIGISAVVGLMSLGQGLENTILAQLSMIGGDRINVQKSGSFGPPGSSSIKQDITLDDVELIDRVKGVDKVGYVYMDAASIGFEDEIRFSIGQGVPLDSRLDVLSETSLLDIVEGRFLKRGDKYKAVVGYKYWNEEIFERKLRLGDSITVNGVSLEIVGVRRSLGNPLFDTVVLMPEDTARDIFDEDEEVSIVTVSALKGEDVDVVAERIREVMRKDRNLDVGQEDFDVSTSQDTLETFQNIFLIVQAIVIGIAAISLLVGGIGIMNTMYTAVLERRNEIGIMKAIGARNSAILAIFMFESGLLGLVGGLIGLAVGVGMSKAVEVVAGVALGPNVLVAHYSSFLILGALAFSFLIGSFSGLFPAKQASDMNPVDALRYE